MEIKSKEIQIISISELKMKSDNRNHHPQNQIEELAKQFKYQGFRNPLIVSNQSGEIVCGNGRFLAAKRAGLKELPVIFQDYDSAEQEYKHHVADNGISLWAELDIQNIKLDLQEFDFDSANLGIKDFNLNEQNLKNEIEKQLEEQEEFILALFANDEKQLEELFEEMNKREIQCKIMS